MNRRGWWWGVVGMLGALAGCAGESSTVWVSGGGGMYHRRLSCKRLPGGARRPMSRDKATRLGFTRCRDCS